MSPADIWTIENKVYAALRGHSLRNGDPLDNSVYIAEASIGKGVTVVITLTSTPAVRSNSRQIATMCENAVMVEVPEVTRITVVDATQTVIDSVARK